MNQYGWLLYRSERIRVGTATSNVVISLIPTGYYYSSPYYYHHYLSAPIIISGTSILCLPYIECFLAGSIPLPLAAAFRRHVSYSIEKESSSYYASIALGLMDLYGPGNRGKASY